MYGFSGGFSTYLLTTNLKFITYRERIEQINYSEFKLIKRTSLQHKRSTQVFTVTNILYALKYTILCLMKLIFMKNSGDIN